MYFANLHCKSFYQWTLDKTLKTITKINNFQDYFVDDFQAFSPEYYISKGVITCFYPLFSS